MRHFGTQFSTCAVPMISGGILRFWRDDGSIRGGGDLRSAAAICTGG